MAKGNITDAEVTAYDKAATEAAATMPIVCDRFYRAEAYCDRMWAGDCRHPLIDQVIRRRRLRTGEQG